MSSSAGQEFFEGTEKLLEVWFGSTRNNHSADLRTIDRNHWEKILKMVRCDIISYMRDDDMDAYMLSESSMFVTKNRLILKTCGTTTLLAALRNLLLLVKRETGFDTVDDIFYSRKNFVRPELQHSVHQSFDREVDHLDQLFTNGAAYVLGQMNKDCWYLYTLDNCGIKQPDQTLEILMWGLCPARMQIFTREISMDGREATQMSGICDLIPGLKIDDYLFDPCGYSMNGILPGGYYITIHVTPESHCSYVSFESNIPQDSYYDLIKKVLQIFCPQEFLLTIFANKASIAHESHKYLDCATDTMDGYVCRSNQFCILKNYHVTFGHFTRPVI